MRWLPLLLALLAPLLAPLPAQDRAQEPTHYKGRRIARTMRYAGANWLIRESREREEECSTLLRALGIEAGDVVCDFGSGNGFYTLPIAELVGDTGKVIAVDIQPQMLALLKKRAAKTKVASRIETVVGHQKSTGLRPNSIDLCLMVDVYHELTYPEQILRDVRKSLKPGGRIVLAEFRMEDPAVPIKLLHKMSKRQVLRELVPNGFRLVEQFDRLPWQHLMFFEATRDDELANEVRGAMARATKFLRSISTHGGYAGIYSLDLSHRYGEALYERAGKHEIWVQPPGTPSVGQVFLDAFRLTGDDTYFEAARDAGRALAWGQREAGGWDHRADVSKLTADAVVPEPAKGHCTFDDDISQGALTFLIELDDVVEERWLTNAVRRGIAHLLASQFEGGAWPQWFPLRGGYHDYYTFNDNAINDCIRVALLANERYGRKDCEQAALAGGDFIRLSQLPGKQAGWAQQYSHDLAPAAARRFEPAAVCSAVTARNIRTLIELFLRTGEERFVTPIPKALAWLERSKLREGRWARLYELETNRPIYGDRDGRVHYTLSEISEERRNGYAWQGSFGVPSAARAFAEVERLGRDGYRGRRAKNPGPDARRKAARSLAPRVRKVIAALDETGRWVLGGRIHIADFVRNMRTLCDYLDRL